VIRAVVDPGVLVSALITPAGSPADVLRAARQERFDLVISPRLLAELAGVLRREKFRRYVTLEEAAEYVEGVALLAETVADVSDPPREARDPNGDYLIALTRSTGARALVSGDLDLLAVEARGVSVFTPRDFLAFLA
jgi:uncharacterized protein